MSTQIEAYARTQLKNGLAKLTERHHRKFKQIYSFENMDAGIDDVVDNMPEEKLNCAMQQVEHTLSDLSKKKLTDNA